MNDSYKFANAVSSVKTVYLKDAEKYEDELANLPTDPANADTPVDTDHTTPDKQSDHDWEKRYSDLKSYMDKQLNQMKTALETKNAQHAELQQKLKEAETRTKTYPVSEEQLVEWAETYPDFFNVLVTITEKNSDKNLQLVRDEIKRLEEAQEAIAKEKGWQELLKYHPDANEIKDDPRFASWFEVQPSGIQALIGSKNPKEVAKGIALYKEDMGIKPVQKNKTEKEASQAVTVAAKSEPPQGKKVWLESEIAKMHPNTYLRLEEEIELARREGRFKYDVSIN